MRAADGSRAGGGTLPRAAGAGRSLAGAERPLSGAERPLSQLSVGALLRARAAQHPDRVALVGTSVGDGRKHRLSYDDLLHRAAGVAAEFLRLVSPGAHVALVAHNVVEWTVVQMGAALAGVVLVAVNPWLEGEEMAYVLAHSEAAFVVYAPTGRGHDIEARVLAASRRCSPRPIVRALTEWSPPPADPTELPPSAAPPVGAAAMLQYTSGTTGRPKGVLLAHRSIVNNGRFLYEELGVAEGAVTLSALPAFHTGGCVCSTLGPLWIGGTLVLVDRFAPVDIVDQLAREAVHYLVSVTSMLHDLIDHARSRSLPELKLRRISTGAAIVSPGLIAGARELFGATVCNVYGQTEMAPVISFARPGSSDADALSTVGTPLPHTELRITAVDGSGAVPTGVPGEIEARGFGAMLGYWADPAETGVTVDAHGWVRTGDLGSLDGRGYLTVVGRRKELIIRGGENIAPAQIETCLDGHAAVLRSAVFGLPEPRLGEVVAAAVVLRAAATPGLVQELRDYCAQRLPYYCVPGSWFFLAEFPLTASGKVRKHLLREGVELGTLTPVE